MKGEAVYKMMKAQNYLPGSMRYRVGSLNEHEDQCDTTKFNTIDGRAFVVEYRTFEEGGRTYSDVYEIEEIDTSVKTLLG